MVFRAFALLFVIYPYFYLLSDLARFNGQGKNPILLGIVLSLVAVFFLAQGTKTFWRERLPARRVLMLWLLFVSVIVVSYFRILYFSHATLNFFLSSQTLFFLFFYLFLVFKVIDSHEKKKILLSIVIWNTLISAVVGIVHHTFFPTVNLLPHLPHAQAITDVLRWGASRETGIQLNASGYAYFLLLGMVAIAYKVRVQSRSNQGVSLALSVVLWYGIFLSQSRSPIAMGLVFLLYTLVYVRHSKVGQLVALGFVVFILYIGYKFLGPLWGEVAGRFSHGGDARLIKADLAWGLLFSHLSYFLIGVPASVVASTKQGGLVFSDNSYLTSMLAFGVILGSCYMSYYFGLLFQFFRQRQQRMLLAAFFITLGLTNAILWNFWILYVMVLLVCMGETRVIDSAPG